MPEQLWSGHEIASHAHGLFDAVVCGAGAGGSMAARELARAGWRVLLLEEGGDHLPAQFTQREEQMFPELYQELGGRRTDDLSILVLSGRGLGGSTIHNTNLCKRIPPEVLEHWVQEHHLPELSQSQLAELFAEVENDLGVRPIADHQVNTHNQKVELGIQRLGYRGGRLAHNRDERCIGSGFCELGCAYDGKLNARRVLIPQALASGAAVGSGARVLRILHDGRRVSGVLVQLSNPDRQLQIRCRAAFLAGGAIGSATLALTSGLPDPHLQAGRHLRLHPGAAVGGVFAEPLRGWQGIPQSVECTEFLDFTPGSTRRVWLVPSFAHPIGTAAMLPGFGPELFQNLRQYPHLGVLTAMVHDESEGRVYLDGERTRIHYRPNSADREQLALGVRESARILLAAGAGSVLVPTTRPVWFRQAQELSRIDADWFLPNQVKLTSVHPMGSLRMGGDPKKSVVNALGHHHHLSGLYVCDASLFPSSLGTPPQMSVYTFALWVARNAGAALHSA